MINQQLIKSVNKKELYTMISENPGISRAQLASLRKLSKTTVSALVEELIQEGYRRRSGGEQKPGPQAQQPGDQ